MPVDAPPGPRLARSRVGVFGSRPHFFCLRIPHAHDGLVPRPIRREPSLRGERSARGLASRRNGPPNRPARAAVRAGMESGARPMDLWNVLAGGAALGLLASFWGKIK